MNTFRLLGASSLLAVTASFACSSSSSPAGIADAAADAFQNSGSSSGLSSGSGSSSGSADRCAMPDGTYQVVSTVVGDAGVGCEDSIDDFTIPPPPSDAGEADSGGFTCTGSMTGANCGTTTTCTGMGTSLTTTSTLTMKGTTYVGTTYTTFQGDGVDMSCSTVETYTLVDAGM